MPFRGSLASGRVLCLPGDFANRSRRRGAGGPASPRGGCQRARRDGLRPRWPEPHPGLVRELAAEPGRGACAHPIGCRTARRGERLSSGMEDTAARPRVFVARRIPAAGLDAVLAGCDAVVWEDEAPPTRDELLRAVAGFGGGLTVLA